MPAIDRHVLERRLRALLEELSTSPTARREMRYHPAQALSDRGWNVPEPPSLPVTLRRMAGFVWDSDAFAGSRSPRHTVAAETLPTDLLLFAFGERPAALLHLGEQDADQMLSLARSRGWAAMIGPFAMTPIPDRRRGGFADIAGEFRAPVPGSGGYRALVVARSVDVAALIWLSLLFGWDDYLGDLLGYPACCTAAFPDAWSRAQTAGGDVAVELAGPAQETVIRPAASSNTFVRVLGAGLPLHFPCSLNCPATETAVRRQLAVLRVVEPQRAKMTQSLLNAPTLLSREGEVVSLVGGTVVDGSEETVTYDPERLWSSDPTSTLTRQVALSQQFSPGHRSQARLVLPHPIREAQPLTGVVS